MNSEGSCMATSAPRLSFRVDFDERTAVEVENKGWCGIAFVELPGGEQVDVFFYDPIRLAQDLQSETKSGHAFIAEPGLIVIPRVTLAFMEAAVKTLFEQGYFDN